MSGCHSAGKKNNPVTVEDGAWTGVGSMLLGGIRIGKKSIIAADSVVISDIPSFAIAAGVPCKVKKEMGLRKQDVDRSTEGWLSLSDE